MRARAKTICVIFLAVFLISVALSLYFFRWVLNTPLSKQENKQYFEINNNKTIFEIANQLKEKGIIRSDLAFYANAKFKGKGVASGVYEVSPNMSILKIYNMMVRGDTKIIKVTIPEGYRTEQIAQVLDNKEIINYSDFLVRAKKYEGKLFPDTYYLTPMNTVDEVIKIMLQDFENRTSHMEVSSDDLVLASIVEREAGNDQERPIIAGIYKNRINKKMKLEADPTVQYGKDNNAILSDTSGGASYRFWQPITSKDYKGVNSNYNTYIITGLPLSPICNPGLKSIEAVKNYEKNDYLYFFNANGQIYPSKTLDEHEQNKKKYLY